MIHLAPGIFFTDCDGVGVLCDAHHNQYLDLSPEQTRFLTTLLTLSAQERHEAIDDSDAEERAAFVHTLLAQRLVSPGPGVKPWCSSQEPLFPAIDQSRGKNPSPALRAPAWESPASFSWELFVTGTEDALQVLPSFSGRKRFAAIAQSLAGLCLFRRFEHGPWLLEMQRSFARLRPADAITHLSAQALQACGRRELLREQLVLRLFAPRARCVPRSLALCAYLRALGLPAQFVLARARYTFGSAEFHAWTQVCGLPVNEPDELPSGYAIFTAIP